MRVKPGQQVTIRQWHDMANEYILIGQDIDCPGGVVFDADMRHLCGETLTVTYVGVDDFITSECDSAGEFWFFTEAMTEEFKPGGA